MKKEVDYVCIFMILLTVSCYARKNVLFLMADDMRVQLGSYVGKHFPASVSPEMHTPSLDALASRSLLLERAYAQFAKCSPSRTSLLTGRRPETTRVWENGKYFREVGGDFTTLPQYFKENGYKSIGIGKIYHPGKQSSGEDDPDSWSEPYFNGVNNFESKNHSWNAIPDELLVNKPLRDQQVADQAIKALQRLAPAAKSGEQPFFIAVGFYKPHLPFVFPKSFLDYYPTVELADNPQVPNDFPEAAWFKYGTLRGYRDIRKLKLSGEFNTTIPDDLAIDLRRAYYSAISFTDSLVGNVLAELENLGLANDTIVSFVSDHGYQLGEHAEWTKHTNFELSVQSPMMVHVPGLTNSGIKTDQLTELVDLYPTLVEAAGLEPLPLCPIKSRKTTLCREGSSLIPLISDPDEPIKTASFSEYLRLDPVRLRTKKARRKGYTSSIMGYTVRTHQYRYTEWTKFKYPTKLKPKWNRLVGVELYDHKTDPWENVNYAYDSQYANKRKQLSKILHDGWRSALI